MSSNPWQASVEQVRGDWKWFLALGVFLVLLGTIGIGAASFFTDVIVILCGFLMLTGGIAQIAQAFWARRWSGFLLQLIIGILDIVIGLFMIARPGKAELVITLLLAAWFVAGGLFRMIGGLALRFPNWGWMVFGGFVTALLGLAVLAEFPQSGEFFLGLYVGISLLFQGWSWIMLALSLRSLPATPNP